MKLKKAKKIVAIIIILIVCIGCGHEDDDVGYGNGDVDYYGPSFEDEAIQELHDRGYEIDLIYADIIVVKTEEDMIERHETYILFTWVKKAFCAYSIHTIFVEEQYLMNIDVMLPMWIDMGIEQIRQREERIAIAEMEQQESWTW